MRSVVLCCFAAVLLTTCFVATHASPVEEQPIELEQPQQQQQQQQQQPQKDVGVGAVGGSGDVSTCSEDGVRTTALVANLTQHVTDTLNTDENEMRTYASQATSAIDSLSSQVQEVAIIVRARRMGVNQLLLRVTEQKNVLAGLQVEDIEIGTMSNDLELECQRQEKLFTLRKQQNVGMIEFLKKLRLLLEEQRKKPTTSDRQVFLQGITKILPNLLPAKATHQLQSELLVQLGSDNAGNSSNNDDMFSKIGDLLDQLEHEAEVAIERATHDTEDLHVHCQQKDEELRAKAKTIKENIGHVETRIKELDAQVSEEKRGVTWAKIDLDVLQHALDEKTELLQQIHTLSSSRRAQQHIQISTLTSLLAQPLCCMCNNNNNNNNNQDIKRA